MGGSASDIKIQAEQIRRNKRRFIQLIAQHTGQDEATIERDSDRDHWFNAEEAKDYGLIDEIMHSARDLPGGGGTGA
jgi:ATP-dependent Clp protease protease subunit